KIKQLESGKSVKELSDKDKARKDTDEKDKRIAELEAQIAHRKALDETDQVLRGSGLSVPSDVLGFLVSDNADTTYTNVKVSSITRNQSRSLCVRNSVKATRRVCPAKRSEK
uniref:capsid assembly scaffolding protein Gp46 family protein n=1 Tax=Ligilactobacillus sp. TaxID=2767921 RepID=UPI002FE09801